MKETFITAATPGAQRHPREDNQRPAAHEPPPLPLLTISHRHQRLYLCCVPSESWRPHLTQNLRTFSRYVYTLPTEEPPAGPAPHHHHDADFHQQRAQELVAVNKNLGALELLHDHVTSKRTRNSPIASLEPVMILFVELCVSLRKGKTAKDGLYQYKNIAQNTSVQTIEVWQRAPATMDEC